MSALLTAQSLNVTLGRHSVLHDVTFALEKQHLVALVGPNGAGKTTLTRVLAGEGHATTGHVARKGTIGYLPQDPRTGNLEQLAMERILDARELGNLTRRLREAEQAMAGSDEAAMIAAMERYPKLEERFSAAGGYAAEER